MENLSLSDLVSWILAPFKHLFFYHKKKLLFFLISCLLLLAFLFPYSDLTFYSQNKINSLLKSTGMQVSYSEINFNFLPFGAKTENFNLQLPSQKNIQVDEVVLQPDLLSLLAFKPGASLYLSNIFGGNINLGLSSPGKTNENLRKFKISIANENISILQILEFLGQNHKVKGKLFGTLEASGEESFRQQPEGKFKFNLKNVDLPMEIVTPIGAFSLPEKVKWKNSNIFGKISNGQIAIEEGTLGTKTSPVNGRFKGNIECPAVRMGANVKVECVNYSLNVELEISALFEREFASNLSSLINSSRAYTEKLPQGGKRYLFSVSGGKYRPPVFRAIRNL